MRIKKSILVVTLSMGLIQSASFAQSSKARFTTLDMVTYSAPALFDCAHYCIVGFQVRGMYQFPASIKIFYTPVVRHNTADLLVMSADETGDMPWLEYNLLFSKPAKLIGDNLLRVATGQLAPVGGGQTQFKNFGQHQSLKFKDADVVGTPMAYVVEKLGAKVKGHRSPSVGNVSPEQAQAASTNFLQGMASNAGNIVLDGSLLNSFGSSMYREMVKAHPFVVAWENTVKTMVRTFAMTLPKAQVDYFGCDSDAEPFKPFYVSNLDGFFWRDGFPVTDPHMSATILNPLSSDVIKPSGAGISGVMGGWGHLYPRAGFVNASDDYKIGAVTATRALNIATDPNKIRIHQNAGGSYESTFYQVIHPNPSISCHKNIADSIGSIDNNHARNYAWNGWRRYQCPLTRKGFVIATVIWGETMCLGTGAR